ncbi:MAG TPA: orotidine-5'-phosphate decarboxylase [Candidatus Binataceae bacterium]|jgi:orotidine-5'-phosphate decarboxylase|nr:orotidine-5'-phosphate decarboxylase [Candidatus Binataceae bacterium]
MSANDFVERIVAAQRARQTIAVLGVDPQLDTAAAPGIPKAYTLTRFCCEIIEACAPYIVAVKPQVAFFEARGLDGLRAFAEVIRFARSLDLVIIADAKRGDIGSTSAAYAEAFLGTGEFGCDAITVNPYLGSDALAPFVAKARNGRGVFVLVKTSNPSSGEFQDRSTPDRPLWEVVAKRVHGWASDYIGSHDLTPVGAVIGGTYPDHARRARELMPNSLILVPGYGTQGADAKDAVVAIRRDGLGVIVNASRSLMYAWRKREGLEPAAAAAEAANQMRRELNAAIAAQPTA